MSYPQAIPTRLDARWGSEPLGGHRIPLFGAELESLRNRARNLERRSVLASATLDRCTENVVGTGISLRSASTDAAWKAAVDRRFARFAAGKMADVRRMLTWQEMQAATYRARLRDGDVLILLIDEGEGPQLQIIGGDAIATPVGRDDRMIRDGVEIDGRGRPVAYWVRTFDAMGVESFRRIEANDAIFYHRSPRHDVLRGESAFNGSFSLYEQIEGYLDAVVVAARIGASYAMIRKRKKPAAAGNGLNPLRVGVETGRGEVVDVQDVEPGTITTIDSDDDLVAYNPSQPTQSFPDALRAFGRFIGLKFGLTVQRVLLDFTQTNYSGSRSTALQEQRFAEPEQVVFVESFLRRVYQWLVAKWAKRGEIVDEKGVRLSPPEDAWAFEWTPPARPLVEPSKDAPGQKVMIDMNVESYRNVAASNGYDLDQIIADNAADLAKMRAAGIDPHAIVAAMAPPQDEQDADEEPPEEDDEQPENPE